jgi:hypothetical protein
VGVRRDGLSPEDCQAVPGHDEGIREPDQHIRRVNTVVVEHQDKDQAAGLELAESFILCGHRAYRTHIKNITVFIHKD